MRNLIMNGKPIYGVNYNGKEEVLGSDGYRTGEYRIQYGKAYPFRANVSGAKGNAIVETIGLNLEYDKVIVISLGLFKHLEIDENTVFFIDKAPEYDENDLPLYDYKIKRICDTLNEVVIAVEKVRNN